MALLPGRIASSGERAWENSLGDKATVRDDPCAPGYAPSGSWLSATGMWLGWEREDVHPTSPLSVPVERTSRSSLDGTGPKCKDKMGAGRFRQRDVLNPDDRIRHLHYHYVQRLPVLKRCLHAQELAARNV